MLLQLPSELLLDILGFLDPATFYQCLLASKIILSHVRRSKILLRQQIDSVPGPKSREMAGILTTMSAGELFTLFTRRARINLLHGVADTTVFKLPVKTFKFGAFRRCSCYPESHLYMALVNTKSGTIGIHLMGNEANPILKCVISPRHLNLDSTGETQFQVLNCAFAECNSARCCDQLAVLYSYRLPENGNGPFVRQAQQQSKLFTKLVVWRLWASNGVAEPGAIEDVYVGDGREPAALGVSPLGFPLVAFRSPKRALDFSVRSEWTLPTWEAEQYSTRCKDPMAPSSIVARTGKDEGLLTPSEILTKGTRAFFSFPLAPTPQWEMHDFLRPGTLLSNFDSFETLARVGIARRDCGGLILDRHHHCDRVNLFHVDEILQLHFQAHGEFAGAYIIKSVEISDECEPYTPAFRYPNLQSKIVAQLDGINMSASRSSSLGLILAVSPSGKRIAVASWDCVQVWTLDPMAFFMVVKHHIGIEKANLSESRRLVNPTSAPWHDADSDTMIDSMDGDGFSLGSSESDDLTNSTDSTSSTDSMDSYESPVDDDSMSSSSTGEPDECDWLRQCGWDYFSCFGRKRLADEQHNVFADLDEIVKLQPVSLPRCGVVHSLEFADDDIL